MVPEKPLQSLLSSTLRSEWPRWVKLDVDCPGSTLVTPGPGTESRSTRVVGSKSGLLAGGSGAGVEPLPLPLPPPPQAVAQEVRINAATIRFM